MSPTRRPRPRTRGDPQRHPVQPRPDRISRPDRPCAACQHQERRLEGVLGLVAVAEHRATDSQHHRAVPRHQCGEGGLGHLVVLAATGREAFQQLVVAQPGRRPRLEQGGQVSRRDVGWSACHGSMSPEDVTCLLFYPDSVPEEGRQSFFLKADLVYSSRETPARSRPCLRLRCCVMLGTSFGAWLPQRSQSATGQFHRLRGVPLK